MARLFALDQVKIAWYSVLRLAASKSPTVPAPNSAYRWRIWGGADPTLSVDFPKNIWAYWSGNPSPTAEACRRSWDGHSRQFKINVIRKESLCDFLEDFPQVPDDLPQQKVSNLVRLMLLERYGGIWMDYSTLLTEDLSWVPSALDDHGVDMLAFYNEYPDEYRCDTARPIIENGFLAARPGSGFIRRWREIYQECIMSDDYRTFFSSQPDFSRVTANFLRDDFDSLAYFVCYVAAQKTMLESDNHRLLLVNCEDEYYHTYYNTSPPRNKRKFAEELLLKDYRSVKPPRVIKITGGHRSRIDEHIKHMAYRKNSLLGKYL